MQQRINNIESEVIERLYRLFILRYQGNNSKLAKASDCSETTIRRVFSGKQGVTLNLFLRICNALEVTPIEVLNESYH
ncbi:Cro/C1-type HTH DNA-binding domain-containing protein [Flavobacterium fontis]|uniref:Cro/C1-type HTH DNA-binding domain-containing protein n=1 Tax=Flavobacterium fontis TaxID=1124188 RepID=A0A1M4WBG9_9FLAO|nr:Cro/C1-type HTH DNA-binding domain-containing protein [Flavobacterium fontis]